MRYEIYAKFDDLNASLYEIKAYFKIMGEYDIMSIGHEKLGTTTMFTHSIDPRTLRILLKELEAEGIKTLLVQPTFRSQKQLNMGS